MGVSKTDYMRGLQCPKMLWLDKHKPEMRMIPPHIQQRLDEGNAFGDKAMGMFGPFVEVDVRDEEGAPDYLGRIQKTKELIEAHTPVVCEAAFSYYGCYCAVDILRKVRYGYEIYEVKNSDSVKPQFIKDVGFQAWVAEYCGVSVMKCFIVLPKKDEAGERIDGEYEIVDVTDEAVAFAKEVNQHIWRLAKIKKQTREVEVPMGEHCNEPYECWYKRYCEVYWFEKKDKEAEEAAMAEVQRLLEEHKRKKQEGEQT